MPQLAIDPWASDYGPSLDLEEGPIQAVVDLELEGPWRAHGSGQTPPLTELALVDGVRRLECNLRSQDQGQSFRAAIGSQGCGALLIRPGQAQSLRQALHQLEVQTYLVLEAPEGPQLEGMITLSGVSDVVMALHQRMREREAALADRVAAQGILVLADGPLQNTHSLLHEVVGYIKSQHRQLLPPEAGLLLTQLAPGQRTPIFALSPDSHYHRFSWYLRLESPSPRDSSLAGLVRLEMAGRYGLAQAQTRADQLGQLLPLLKNFRHRDPRSPQNLIPIAVLERALRHRLGDPGLRQRRFRQLLSG